ncbi:5597_t:CDS:1, partial [Acaulospora morrowiae]
LVKFEYFTTDCLQNPFESSDLLPYLLSHLTPPISSSFNDELASTVK